VVEISGISEGKDSLAQFVATGCCILILVAVCAGIIVEADSGDLFIASYVSVCLVLGHRVLP
jgi:hypothetical protein